MRLRGNEVDLGADLLTFSAVVRRKTLPFLKVSEQFHRAAGFPDGVLAVFGGPHELLGRTERLVSEGHRGVDDVLAITADDYESVRKKGDEGEREIPFRFS